MTSVRESLRGDAGTDVVHGDNQNDLVVDGGPGDYDRVYGDLGLEGNAVGAPAESIISGGTGIHDNCKQEGPSDPTGYNAPDGSCENDVP